MRVAIEQVDLHGAAAWEVSMGEPGEWGLRHVVLASDLERRIRFAACPPFRAAALSALDWLEGQAADHRTDQAAKALTDLLGQRPERTVAVDGGDA